MFFLVLSIAFSQKLINLENDVQKCLCIGQESLELCLEQIEDKNIVQSCSWEYSNNLEESIYYSFDGRIYITNDQSINDFSKDIIVTNNAHVMLVSNNIFIKSNGVNTIVAQSQTSKITIVPNNKLFAIHYESAPTNFDLSIALQQSINLALSVPPTYEKEIINIEGVVKITIREQFKELIDIFNYPETITFEFKTDNEYDAICYSDNPLQCSNLMKYESRDFVTATTTEELYQLEKSSESSTLAVLIFKPFEFSMSTEFHPSTTFFFGEGSTLTFDVPDQIKFHFYDHHYFLGINLIATKIMSIFVTDNKAEITFKVKDTVYFSVDNSLSDINFIPKIKFELEKKTLEVIPEIEFNTKFDTIGESRFSIQIPDDVTIKSPLLQNLGNLFGSAKTECTSTCVYLDESGKDLCDSTNIVSFNDAKNADINTKHIIFTTGSNQTIKIPDSWTSEHYYISISKPECYCFYDQVSTVSYNYNEFIVNDKYHHIVGYLIIMPSPSIKINLDVPSGFRMLSSLYMGVIYCIQNEQTDLYTDKISNTTYYVNNHDYNDIGHPPPTSSGSSSSSSSQKLIIILGFDENHKLIIHVKGKYELEIFSGLTSMTGEAYEIVYDNTIDSITSSLNDDGDENASNSQSESETSNLNDGDEDASNSQSESETSNLNDDDSGNSQSEESTSNQDDKLESSTLESSSIEDDKITDTNPYQPELSIPSSVTLFMTGSYCQMSKDYFDKCKNGELKGEDCDDMPFDLICSSASTINDDLSKVKSESDHLHIQLTEGINNVDFNKLNHKMTVDVYYTGPDDDEDDDEAKILHSKSAIKRMHKKKKLDDSDGLELPIFNFNGNIASKVSYLHVVNMIIQVNSSPIKIENLQLTNSYIDSKSQNVEVNNMIVEGYSHYLILMNSKDKIHVTQYALKESEIKDIYDNDNQIQYRISFESDKWIVYSKSYNDKVYGKYFEAGFDAEVPYEFCQRLCLFGISHYFDLYVKDNDIKTAKAANISLIHSMTYAEIDEDDDNSHLLEDNKNKFSVRLTTSGNWDGINDKLSLYFTSFSNYVTLDTKECNSKISIEQYDFKNLPNSSPSIEINDTTIRENNDLGSVTASDNSNLLNEIKNLFNKENLKDSIDHVVTVKGTETVDIYDLEQSNNKFVRLEGNQGTFNLINGSLNVMINQTSSNIKVNIVNNEDIKLTIKNMDLCTVVLDVPTSSDEQQKKKDIKITSSSDVYGPLTFSLGKNVQSVLIDSINLHESGSLSSDQQITVTNIIAQPKTIGKITNIIIDKDLKIEQSAVLELDNTNLEKATVNLNLHTYNQGNFDKPVLKGKLGKHPSSIVLSQPNDGSKPLDNHKYLLFQGDFDDTCNNWKDIVNLDQTSFDDKNCIDFNGNDAFLLNERKSLVVSKIGDGGGGKQSNNGNKLTSGQIAGIVVGCVAFVAIVVVVVVIVIRKRKNNKLSSDGENGKELDL